MAAEEEQQKQADPSSPSPFDPSRMIGIIKRKALIKELAALYHAECLAYCQELLELQKKWEEGVLKSSHLKYGAFNQVPKILACAKGSGETLKIADADIIPFVETKAPDDSRKEITRLSKRLKKTR